MWEAACEEYNAELRTSPDKVVLHCIVGVYYGRGEAEETTISVANGQEQDGEFLSDHAVKSRPGSASPRLSCIIRHQTMAPTEPQLD